MAHTMQRILEWRDGFYYTVFKMIAYFEIKSKMMILKWFVKSNLLSSDMVILQVKETNSSRLTPYRVLLLLILVIL